MSAPVRPSMAPSSPASRPRPAGGLRPALTPAAGGAGQHRPGASRKEDRQAKIQPTEVSTVSGDCHGIQRRAWAAAAYYRLDPADPQRYLAVPLVHTEVGVEAVGHRVPGHA